MENFNQQANLGFDAKTITQQQNAEANFNEVQQKIQKSIKTRFRPEFLNRIDNVLFFKPLSQEAITKIAQQQLKQLRDRLKQRDVQLTIGARVAFKVGKLSYAPDQGARAIRRTIHQQIENPIAKKLLKRNVKTIRIQVENGQLIIR